MIFFSKGQLSELMQNDTPYLLIFMILYYSIAIFMMNGAAVFIQKNALKRVVLSYGMNNGSILDSFEPPPVLERNEALKANKKATVNFTIQFVSWTFGWMPKTAINSFQRFMTD